MVVKRLAMFELESQVMEVLWDQGRALAPREVQSLLPNRDLAYTTVMTVLVRLWQKQLLDRVREGRAFVYLPRLSRGDYAARKMREILSSSGNTNEALASFVKGIDPNDLASLKELMREIEE
jgi:predicted transcriptional regulator